MLTWPMIELAAAAHIFVSTVKRMELTGPRLVSDEAFLLVRTALEREGTVFLPDEGQGLEIRLKAA